MYRTKYIYGPNVRRWISILYNNVAFGVMNAGFMAIMVSYGYIGVVHMATLVGNQSERRKFALDQSESRISPM